MSRVSTIPAIAVAAVLAGCSAGADSTRRENEELRRLLIETRTDLEEIKRDQEQLRSTVEFLQHSRGAAPAGGARREQAARWPADPWSSPDPFAGTRPGTDLDSLEPGRTVPSQPPPQELAAGTAPTGAPSTMPPPAPGGAPLPPLEPSAQPPAAPPPAIGGSQQAPSSDIVAGVRGGGSHPEPGTMGVSVPPPAVPSNLSGTLYEQAVSAFNAGQYETAIQHFRDYIHKEPQSAFADDAQFWIGESNLRKGQYSNAIKEFNQVVLRYASGDRSAASLLKLAEVFSKIGDQVDARLSLQKLVNRYPGSAEAAEAYRLLQEMGG